MVTWTAFAILAMFYLWGKEGSCTEAEVEDWLMRRRNGKEKRVLIIDSLISRGWEVSHAVVVAQFHFRYENLVMRTVGYCALVKFRSCEL